MLLLIYLPDEEQVLKLVVLAQVAVNDRVDVEVDVLDVVSVVVAVVDGSVVVVTVVDVTVVDVPSAV